MKKQIMKVLKRLKKKRVFLAVASGVVMLLLNLGLIDEAISQQMHESINILLSMGVAVGIFTNPDEKPKKVKKHV